MPLVVWAWAGCSSMSDKSTENNRKIVEPPQKSAENNTKSSENGSSTLEESMQSPYASTYNPDTAAKNQALQRLLEELGRLPGIGPKSAQRIAYYLLEKDVEEAHRLTEAISDVKELVHFCPVCFSYATGDVCEICANPARDHSIICVVSEPRDVSAIERTHSYDGTYHVLGGAFSPLDGIGEEELHVKELLARLADDSVTEVILATNPDVEGEATATYLARRYLAPLDIKVTRLASGLPVGGELEFADEVTLGRAIEGRRLI